MKPATWLPGVRGFLESTATRPLRETLGAHPSKLVRIIYSDEAGTNEEREAPVVVVAAVMIDGDNQWPLIEVAVRNILERYLPENKRNNFEFKAARLYGQLSKGNNAAILCSFLQVIETFQLPIPWGAVNRAGMRSDFEAKGLHCSIETMQNLAFVGAAVHAETIMDAFWPNERAIWIADETRAKYPMKASLRQYQQAAILDEEPTTQFNHILDSVYFGHSRESIGLQMADACNFFIKRHHMGDSSAERFFEMIKAAMPERDRAPVYSDRENKDA